MVKIAIVTFANYSRGQSRASMSAVMRYTMRPDKTMWEGHQLVSGVNCNPKSAYDNFLATKLLHHKEGGRMFYHMVQSFPKDEQVSPEDAHAMALKLAEHFKGYEVLVCTHVDRDHTHSHFIINSVGMETGKKFHLSTADIQPIRDLNDSICAEYGYSVYQHTDTKTSSIGIAEYHSAAKGESWKWRLMAVIDDAMKSARSKEEFVSIMNIEGYKVRWDPNRQNITYTCPNGKRCRDRKLFGERYLKEMMEDEFRIRQDALARGIEIAQRAEDAYTDDNYPVQLDERGYRDDRGATAGYPYTEQRTEFNRSSSANTTTDERSGVDGIGYPKTDGTGWEEERKILLAAQHQIQSGDAFAAGPAGGVLGAVVQLGKTLEHSDAPVPMMDATGKPVQLDRKRIRELREKKIAAGHAEDDSLESEAPEMQM